MHKAIQLTVKLWIEGEDEPADDFAKFTTQAVQDMISAGRWRHPRLKVTIKKIVEDEDDEDDDDVDSGQNTAASAAKPGSGQAKK